MAPRLAVAANGGSLFKRIERVLAPPKKYTGSASTIALLCMAAALLAVVIALAPFQRTMEDPENRSEETAMSNIGPSGNDSTSGKFEATPAGICEAARAGAIDAIKSILHEKPELLIVDNPHNWTKTIDGHDISGSYNTKPVEVAAFFNQPQAVAVLLKIGGDSNLIDDQPTGSYFNSLRVALAMGHADVVKIIEDDILARVDAAPELLRKPEENRDTLLFHAAQKGHVSLVRKLLERGADPTVRSRIGHTVIQTILDGSADPERRDVARLLVEKGAPVTIWEATAMEDVDRVTAILADNPDIARQAHQWTISYPLVRASLLGNREIVKLLLDHGADVNATNVGVKKPPEFSMPLYYAASRGHYDIANLLLDHGASPNAHGNAVPPLVDLLRERIAQYDPSGFGTGSPAPKTENPAELKKLYDRLRSLGAEPFLHTLIRVRDHIEIERLLRDEADTIRHVYGRGQKKPTYDVLAQASAWLGDLKTTQLCFSVHPKMHSVELANAMIDSAIRSHNRDGSYIEYRGIIEANLKWLKQNNKLITGAPLWSLATNFLENYRYSPNPELPQMSELIELAELFLEYGADINARDPKSNHSALSQTVVEGHTEYVSFLLKSGASTMQNDPPETHPLLLAEERGLTAIVELLKADGAKLKAELASGSAKTVSTTKDSTVLTPKQCPENCSPDAWRLFVASANGDLATVQQIIRDTPKLLNSFVWYESPLHYAVRENQIDVARELLAAGINPGYSNFTYSSWQSLLPIAKDRGFDQLHALLVGEMQKRFNYDPGYEPLWQAIVDGEVADVKQLIDANPKLINIGDEHGNRPIHRAILARRLPVIEVLLDAGADIEARRADMQTPLHLAIEGSDYHYRGEHKPDSGTTLLQVVELLRDRGADYEFSNAVALNDLEQVQSDLTKQPELAKQLNQARRSPLYLAAVRGHIDMVRLLLAHGADPNLAEHCAGSGRALFEAATRHDIEMMKLLIAHGANADAYVDSSGNCLSIAQHGDNNKAEVEAVELLKQNGAMPGEWELKTKEQISAALDDESFIPNRDMWSNVLGKILEHDDVDLLKKYVARFGTDAIRNINPAKGWRVPKSDKMLAELISHGADVNARDWYGRTWLHYAAFDETPARADWLLTRGADIDVVDHESGTTPLGLAAWNGGLKIVDLLLNHSANPLLPKNNEWTRPLAFAKAQGHDDVVKRLEQAG